MTPARLPVAAAALWAALWLPPLRGVLEGNMGLHMALQLPLLVAVGVLLVPRLRQFEPPWLARADWLGVPGLMLVGFATSFWMLPRMLDASIGSPPTDIAKFVSLPLLAGLPLGLSWRRMPALGRAFLWANFIPKLGVVGGLYLAAPTRLCAYYRLDQQVAAGWTLITLAAGLAAATFAVAFAGWPPAVRRHGPMLADRNARSPGSGRGWRTRIAALAHQRWRLYPPDDPVLPAGRRAGVQVLATKPRRFPETG